MFDLIRKYELLRRLGGHKIVLSETDLHELERRVAQSNWADHLEGYKQALYTCKVDVSQGESAAIMPQFDMGKRTALYVSYSGRSSFALAHDGVKLTRHGTQLRLNNGRHLAMLWVLEGNARIEQGTAWVRAELEAFALLLAAGVSPVQMEMWASACDSRMTWNTFREYMFEVQVAAYVTDGFWNQGQQLHFAKAIRAALVAYYQCQPSELAQHLPSQSPDELRQGFQFLTAPAKFFNRARGG